MKYKFETFKNLVIENSLKIARLAAKRENFKLKIWVICLFISFSIGLSSQQTFAQTSLNDHYNLDINNIDTAPDKTPDIPKTLGTETKKKVEKIVAVPVVSREPSPLSFSVSGNIFDFGALTPGTAVKRSVDLSVVGHALGYRVLSFQDHPLRTLNNEVVPDSTCDNGSCSETLDALWENSLTYGFAFRCDDISGTDCVGFGSPNSYKQFSDESKREKYQAVMSGKLNGEASTGKVTLKLNVSGTQKPGSYSNTVTLIAVPNY